MNSKKPAANNLYHHFISLLILCCVAVAGCSSSLNVSQNKSLIGANPNQNASQTEEVDIQSLRQSAEQTMQRYLVASLERFSDDAAVQTAIFDSQQQWLAYLTKHCEAEYLSWAGASIQNEQRLMCEIELLQLHTMALWRSFLRFEDSTPAILPEPLN
ncbi:MAG: lysozyme inhibitor LprI family protein [Pseudomonadota bacterium]